MATLAPPPAPIIFLDPFAMSPGDEIHSSIAALSSQFSAHSLRRSSIESYASSSTFALSRPPARLATYPPPDPYRHRRRQATTPPPPPYASPFAPPPPPSTAILAPALSDADVEATTSSQLDDDDPWALPDLLHTSSRAHFHTSSLRRQRQNTIRRQCTSATHLADIAALVARMVQRGEACEVVSSPSSPRSLQDGDAGDNDNDHDDDDDDDGDGVDVEMCSGGSDVERRRPCFKSSRSFDGVSAYAGASRDAGIRKQRARRR